MRSPAPMISAESGIPYSIVRATQFAESEI